MYTYAIVDPATGEIKGTMRQSERFDLLPEGMAGAARDVMGNIQAPKLPEGGRWYSMPDAGLLPAPELEIEFFAQFTHTELGEIIIIRALADGHWPEAMPRQFLFLFADSDTGQLWPPRKRIYSIPVESAEDVDDVLTGKPRTVRALYFRLPAPPPGDWNLTCVGPDPWRSPRISVAVTEPVAEPNFDPQTLPPGIVAPGADPYSLTTADDPPPPTAEPATDTKPSLIILP